MENAKGKRISRIILVLVVTTIVVALAFFAFIMVIGNAVAGFIEVIPPSDGTGCLGERPFSREHIEQMANLQIPESASDLSAYSIAFMDCTIYVRFEMDPEELTMFLGSTYVTAPLQSVTAVPVAASQFEDLPNVLMWDILPTKDFIFGYGSNGSREFQAIAVDISDSQRYVVYVITDLL